MKKKIKIPKTPKEAFTEAELFYKNALETLSKSPIEYGAYKNGKLVKEASAMGYLAALRAIDGYLLLKGLLPERLPQSITEYEKAIARIPRNGKLSIALELIYENLHIFGYYRGGISVDMIKAGFQKARLIIDTFSKT